MTFIKDCSDFIKGISDNEEYILTTYQLIKVALKWLILGFVIGYLI